MKNISSVCIVLPLTLVVVVASACGPSFEGPKGEANKVVLFIVLITAAVGIIKVLSDRHSEALAAKELAEKILRFEALRAEEQSKLAKLKAQFVSEDATNLLGHLRDLACRLRQVSYPGDRKAVAGEIYQMILECLARKSALKPMALDFGRLSYGIGREEDRPSTYDEAAIMNDISVHS